MLHRTIPTGHSERVVHVCEDEKDLLLQSVTLLTHRILPNGHLTKPN